MLIPSDERLSQCPAQPLEFLDALLDGFKLLCCELTYLLTRSKPTIARSQYSGELINAEPDGQRGADHTDAAERFERVTAISVRRSRRRGKKPLPFVVPQGIAAHPR